MRLIMANYTLTGYLWVTARGEWLILLHLWVTRGFILAVPTDSDPGHP